MNIQTISVVVPTKGCVNNCKFCVSRMHTQDYRTTFDYFQYKKRLKHAEVNRVNSLVLTGTGEILQNQDFLSQFGTLLIDMDHPFPDVAVQTSGVLLTKTGEMIDGHSGKLVKYYPNIELLKRLGVNTISLSVSDIFDDENNWKINGTPKKLQVPLVEIIKVIKEQNWNLRLSLNLTDAYDDLTSEEIIYRCKELGADQVTFRKLWQDGSDSKEAKWVRDHMMFSGGVSGPNRKRTGYMFLEEDIRTYGVPQYRLPFGPMVYSLEKMSIVLDDDCMSKEGEDDESLKYVILRENGKLYASWDDEGSLIF